DERRRLSVPPANPRDRVGRRYARRARGPHARRRRVMLGLYSCTDREPRDLAEFTRLTSLRPEAVVCGPLAVAGAGGDLGQARDGDVTCLMDGALYGRATQARAMGLDAGDDAQFVARAHRRF